MSYALNKGIKIHYEIEGEGEPLVLQHGFIGTLDDWHDYGYAEEFKKDYKLILIDARGRGLSDKPHRVEDYHLQTMVSDLVAVLNDLGIEKAHYFGYSMGGANWFPSTPLCKEPLFCTNPWWSKLCHQR